MPRGSLVVVGTGIRLRAQITLEAQQWIEIADKVLFVVADFAVDEWIRQLHPDAESLNRLYADGKPRSQTYEEMVEAILAPVRDGFRVCAAFYGHPGIYVYPSHRAVERARAEGFEARMLPGVSADACLFADLGVDPARCGCQSYDATGFLVGAKLINPHSALILWQIGVIGDLSIREPGTFNVEGLRALVDVLTEAYGPRHEVVVYEAAHWPLCRPYVEARPLESLHEARITALSTLYVPPRDGASFDRAMIARLGLSDPGDPEEDA